MRALLLLLLLLAVACRDSPKQAPAPTPAPTTVADAASAPAPRASVVRVDPRVELVSILCRLAGYDEYTRASGSPYLGEVDRWFAPAAKHPAVATLRELRRTHGIGYDAPMHLAVHLDAAFALVDAAELPAIERRWAGVDLAPLAQQIAAFATASDFAAFRAKHADYYASVEKTLQAAIDKENAVAWFDTAFGRADAAFVVVPSPIAGTMNFGSRATAPDGTQTLYQILGGAPAGDRVDDQLVYLLVHEMAHSYVNPVLARHEAELAASAAKVFALVEKPMRAQQYPAWQIMVNESVVRAVVMNYMREKHGDVAGARVSRTEQRNGFLWINELAEVMRQLAKKRAADERYGLEQHVPAIVAFYDQLAQSYAQGLPPVPFRGPVDAVHMADPVWVVPKTPAVAGYARMIHAQLKKTGAIVTASDTTLREQHDHDLVAYGTPTDNPVIDFVMRSARWKIGKDSIVLGDRTFTGPGLVLIACWYLRDSPSRGVAVYAAPDAANLVGINSLRHGQNDWLVARRQGAAFAILGAGDFPRGGDDMWMLPGETPTTPPLR